MYVDSHTHYDDKRFDGDRDTLLKNMHANGIDYIVHAGADMASSQAGIRLADTYDFIYTAVGVHPHDVKDLQEKDMDTLAAYLNHPKVVAVGEIGLDYYYEHSSRDLQRFWFNKQLKIAKQFNYPVIIHSRDAAEETFAMIKDNGHFDGVIHCYSGSAEMAEAYVKLGFYIGIGGVVTFKNAKKMAEVVKRVPLEKILLETDCPYLSPEPNRGKRNDSNNLPYIADKIAQILQISTEEVANVTKQNAISLFCLN